MPRLRDGYYVGPSDGESEDEITPYVAPACVVEEIEEGVFEVFPFHRWEPKPSTSPPPDWDYFRALWAAEEAAEAAKKPSSVASVEVLSSDSPKEPAEEEGATGSSPAPDGALPWVYVGLEKASASEKEVVVIMRPRAHTV